MFNIAFFDQWFYHIVGWPLILILLLTLMYLRVNWKITTLAVPATLACLSWVMFDLEKTLGRPYMAMPEGKFMYVHHIVICFISLSLSIYCMYNIYIYTYI